MQRLLILTTRSITHNRFLNSITNKLRNNYSIVLACKDISNLKLFNNFECNQIDFPLSILDFFNFKKNILFFKQLLILINNVDLIYVHTPIAAHSLRIVKFFSRRKIKIIYHIHGLRYIPGKYSFKSIIFRFLELLLSFETDIFIVINKLDFLSITKFVDPKKVFLVKGVGVNIPKENQLYSAKSKFFIIGIIGSFKTEKGYNQLFQIAKLLSHFNNIYFYVYGNGNLNWIKKKIIKNKLNNIHIKGFVEDIEKEIEEFTIFLHPSHREGLNVSIQECLVKGIPVVTTNVRGCRDLIDEGYNGFTYEVYDVKKAVENIIKLYKMDSLTFNNLRKNCINYSRKNLDREKLAMQIANIIKNND